MFQRILVPLDGSARAEHAIPVAIRLARASGGTVVFAHIVHPSSALGAYGAEHEAMAVPPSAYEKHLTKAEQYLQHVTDAYANDLAGVHVERELDTGATEETLFSLARLEQIDLMVFCGHRTHDLFHRIFRSMTREAVHHSPVPILVLNEAGKPFLASPLDQPLRILVPLDGSQLAEAALQPALQLLTALTVPGKGEMHLMHVVELPSIEGKPLLRTDERKSAQEQATLESANYLQGVVQCLSTFIIAESRPTIVCSTMVSNHVARTIAEMVQPREEAEHKHSYDLLAMATHGRTGLQLLRLGSVTEHVLGATSLPLLVIRPSQVADVRKPEVATSIRQL